ncbi:conserved hypothetical protein, partial [Trichinella spiralis]|uniref:hypothetical protein n=1 Tax=Trichinella spiralis TaxID=6334 RepID=UPI0001EFDCBB
LTRLSIGAGDSERSRRERAAYWWFAIAVFRRVELGSVDEPSRSARKDDRARDSAFDLPLGTTVVARVFVHFERAVATYRVSGVREPEDVREGDRHRREFLDPDRCPRRGRYT